jgi:Leucine-rich repeat (LRR) protein
MFPSTSSQGSGPGAGHKAPGVENNLRQSASFEQFVMSHMAMHATMLSTRAAAAEPQRSAKTTLPYPRAGHRPLLRMRLHGEWVPIHMTDYTRNNYAGPNAPHYGQFPGHHVFQDGVRMAHLINEPRDLGKVAELKTSVLVLRAEALRGSARSLPLELRRIPPCVKALFLETPQTTKDVEALTGLKSLRHLYILGGSPVDLEALAALPELESLTLIRCNLTRGIRFLAEVEQLQRLRIVNCGGLEGLTGAKGHPNLRHLSIEGCDLIRTHQLNEMPVLTSVLLERCNKLERPVEIREDNPVRDIAIRNCPRLQETHFLSRARRITGLELVAMPHLNLRPVLSLPGLESLNLPEMGLQDHHLDRIGQLGMLRHLDLSMNIHLTGIQPLGKLKALSSLSLDFCMNVKSINPLYRLKYLSALSLAFCNGLESVRSGGYWEYPLRHLQICGLTPHLQREVELPVKELETLGLAGWATLKNLDFLEYAKNLRFLDVRHCPLLEDAGPLKEHRQRLHVLSDPGAVFAESLDKSNPNLLLGPLDYQNEAWLWYDLPKPWAWDDLTWRPQRHLSKPDLYEGTIRDIILPRLREELHEKKWAETVESMRVDGKSAPGTVEKAGASGPQAGDAPAGPDLPEEKPALPGTGVKLAGKDVDTPATPGQALDDGSEKPLAAVSPKGRPRNTARQAGRLVGSKGSRPGGDVKSARPAQKGKGPSTQTKPAGTKPRKTAKLPAKSMAAAKTRAQDLKIGKGVGAKGKVQPSRNARPSTARGGGPKQTGSQAVR